MKDTIFLIGSRTGGPLIPLLGLKDELLAKRPDLDFRILGVRGGFEEKAALSENLPLHFLPEVKGKPSIRILGSSLPARLLGILLLPLSSLWLVLRLAFSTLKAWSYITRFRPALILSMSNFLTVPVVWAAALDNAWQAPLNFLRRLSGRPIRKPVQTALHQLDIQNLTVKLAGPFTRMVSVGFKSFNFRSSDNDGARPWVPNPVRYQKFDALDRSGALRALESSELRLLPGKSADDPSDTRPLLLVFGGGSGARFINNWVRGNLSELRRHFRILHLSGFLQDDEARDAVESQTEPEGYRRVDGLTELMPAALIAADLVICRAGMSTISELIYLRKNAYLVPIPGGHQIHNARAAEPYLATLNQSEVGQWLKVILADTQQNYPRYQAVNWDYYTPESRNLYLELTLKLLDE